MACVSKAVRYSRIKVLNRNRIGDLSKELNLPHWLVEALIVEYLPCRRYFEDGAKVLFDFGQIKADEIGQLPRPAVVLSNVCLIHNVEWSAVARRVMRGLVGLPMAAMGDQKLALPEGRVNPQYIPWVANDLCLLDWKHNLNDLAVVGDGEELYQWRVAKFVDQPAPGAKHGWFESPVFSPEQLDELLCVHDEIIYGALPGECPPEGTALEERQARLASLYERLEDVRASMRSAVVAFHEAHKGTPEATYGYTEEIPPTLTVFDQIGLRDNRLAVRTFVEPLFFRAAYRAMRRARQAQEETIRHIGTGIHLEAVHLEEEIEASAACITLSAMCLEAYINGFIAEKLPDRFKKLERDKVKRKWLDVPKLLGKPDCFDREATPFKNFSDLVDWRNELVHYKHLFVKPVEIHGVRGSWIHSVCNVINAQTAVETVEAMIRRLCESLGEPVPAWADDRGWLNSP